jgi:hypothetical protein
MRLTAHLCGAYCTQLLAGDFSFVRELHQQHGFARVQVNATAANGIDVGSLGARQCVEGLRAAMGALPGVEFILQHNEETRALWEGLLLRGSGSGGGGGGGGSAAPMAAPRNLSLLFDESKGLGTLAASWPGAAEAAGVPFGYAGGLGPDNVAEQLGRMAGPAAGLPVWIDMESSLRTMRPRGDDDHDHGGGAQDDTFDVGKAVRCLETAVELGLARSAPVEAGGGGSR